VAWECVLSNACFTSFEFDLGRLAERSASSSCLVLEDQSTAAAAADDDDDDDDAVRRKHDSIAGALE